MIYNIQDFNPEQVKAVDFTNNRMILSTMMWLDKRSCRRADKIIVVGRDMVDTLKRRFPDQMVSYAHINNWIDEQEIYPLPEDDREVIAFKQKFGLDDKLVFMYSGNIGLYYDLPNILKIISRFRKHREVCFAFIGEGSVLEELKDYKQTQKLDNVIFIPYQDKKDLIYSLNAGDVHFVMNAKGIKGVSVPSKLYGVMAVGRPVLGILEEGSEARLIVEEAQCGITVAPERYDEIVRLIQKFIDEYSKEERMRMGENGHRYLLEHLTKEVSIEKYKEEILSC